MRHDSLTHLAWSGSTGAGYRAYAWTCRRAPRAWAASSCRRSSAGIGPVTVSEVVALRLDQDRPGQLGAFTRRLADAGIDVRVQYSDHDRRLVLIVDPQRHADATDIAARWDAEEAPRRARASRGVPQPPAARR
ncbi:hypothetical protein [Agromyces sp. ZXT2-3]|uniref:hypothetical protein n=1 Tax=Agromyces sp. ZXT2-3 TaxID=3461152 RepID=UPI004054FC52